MQGFGLFMFENFLIAEGYLNIYEDRLWEQVEDVLLKLAEVCFQHDGMPAHFVWCVKQFLN